MSYKDWDCQLLIIQVKAKADNIQDIINPSLTYNIYQILTKPVEHLLAKAQEGTIEIQNLTTFGLLLYLALKKRYKQQFKEYNQKKKTLRDIQSYVINMLGNYTQVF